MAKLIGTNPNQVPSNADLGTAAFMDAKDFLTARGSSLSAIDAIVPKTAVEVFIYDTSKDSDGGAWRKRTQHTSWYNERLNTTTRGSRREFPAVAVIVAANGTGGGIIIYDGDDPTLPMWMVFENSASGWNNSLIPLASSATAISSCFAKNGYLAFGTTPNALGVVVVNFIGEVSKAYLSQTNYGGIDTAPLSKRNTSGHTFVENLAGGSTLPTIINNGVNDVVMTVLPNAPIDSATGLPVPTIAVATNGGVSVIKDDGTVISTASSIYAVGSIQILPTGEIYHSQGYSGNNGFCYNDNFERLNGLDVGTYANSSTFWYAIDGIGNDSSLLGGGLADENAVGEGLDTAVGTASGLTAIALNSSSLNDGMVAWRTSNYNTGWMPGDIKLATLSDTDTTNAVSANMAANGNFADTSVWGTGNGATFSVSGNVGTITGNGSTTQAYIGQTVSGLTVGKQYMITCDAKRGTTTAQAAITVNGILSAATTSTSFVPLHVTFTATATSQLVLCFMNGAGSQSGTALFQNFTFRLAEADRSVNGASPHGGNALQVFGTVTKTAVETGADLVGYSGFSSSNYLQQPYNSDLDFGTGNVSAMGWFKLESTYVGTKILFDRADPSWPSTGSSQRIFFGLNSSDYLYYYTGNGNATTSTAVPSNVWIHACFVRSSTSHRIYMNGELVLTNTHAASSLSGSTNVLTVGNGTPGKANSWPGQMALWRLSATAPSPEQIAKIYNDEKHLFTTNAKATLYGTSDAVTALAYDDSTELLHAGTSAGRSVFQGLRRIDNTTGAVGIAISASNGMVVEE